MRRGRGQGRMARTLTRLGMACGRCAVLPECRAEGWAMPLHDWTDERGWDSVHPVWLTYLLEYVQERLPKGYRAIACYSRAFWARTCSRKVSSQPAVRRRLRVPHLGPSALFNRDKASRRRQ